MIVVDIETSGLDFNKCGVWQIGALELNNPENQFLGEARIDDDDEIQKEALELTGKNEESLRDINKQSQKQLLENFFKWVEGIEIKNFVCENPQFDVGFISTKARKYGLKIGFHHRTFDLHSIAQVRYFQINKKFLFDFDHSDLGLTNILDFVGMSDDREAHNALEDCKLEAECFSRLLRGEGLFEEYNKFKIPNYLKNDNL